MNDRKTSRREFLETMGAVGAASAMMGSGTALGDFLADKPEKLAVDGGTPVRSSGLGSGPYGTMFYDEVEEQELLDVLRSRSPFRSPGGKVAQFETEYAAHLGAKYAIGVTSGTTALYAAMAALEVGPGDEVILPAWNWYADYDVIVLSGALPVFAEIDDSFDIDPNDIERHITPRTKAIIAAHLEGCPCDMDSILKIARKHKLRVLEDCAQCAGGKYKGKYVGTIGDIGINSFQLSKTITSGEGGAVTTNDPVLYERAFRFHDVGTIDRTFNEIDRQRSSGSLRCVQLPHERVHRRRAPRAAPEARNHLRPHFGPTPRKFATALPTCRDSNCASRGDIAGDLGMRIFLDLGNRERRDRFLRAIRAEGISAAGPGGSVIFPSTRG